MINRIFYLIIGLIFIITIYNKVKKKLFSEKESLFWMIASVFMLALSIYPKLIDRIAHFVGIDYPPSLLFLLSTMFLTYLIFRLTQQVSLLKEQNKELAQRIAIIEKYTND